MLVNVSHRSPKKHHGTKTIQNHPKPSVMKPVVLDALGSMVPWCHHFRLVDRRSRQGTSLILGTILVVDRLGERMLKLAQIELETC